MENKGFKQFGLKELINKIKKLRQKYKVEKDKKKRSGNARQKTWKFFDSMDRVLATRHNVNPPTIADTMAENTDKEILNYLTFLLINFCLITLYSPNFTN
jgi:Asp-tRNA(Asn)/Glu-tRNA(Gln) amidotransferase A subunit family amidase